jgi:uncharacterized protein (TIGR03435 family)
MGDLMPYTRILNAAVVGGLWLATAAALTAGQTTQAEVVFEVASIKSNTRQSDVTRSTVSPGGTYSVTRISLHDLILTAYGIDRFQLVGAPSWVVRERFDINARATGELTSGGAHPTLPGALRRLITDRFRLIAHIDVREVPIYALRVLREGRLGPRLSPSPMDCLAVPLNERAPGDCRVSAPGARGRFFAASGPISHLVAVLRMNVDRPVIDKTGVQGNFTIDLTWASVPTASLAALAAGRADEPLPSREGPSIFTAVQEQLGLQLVPEIATMNFVVIDSIQLPTPSSATTSP